MNKELINLRLTILLEVLWQDRIIRKDIYEAKGYFTPTQRFAINQERASLYDQLNVIDGVMKSTEARHYQVAEVIEKKIEFIINKL